MAEREDYINGADRTLGASRAVDHVAGGGVRLTGLVEEFKVLIAAARELNIAVNNVDTALKAVSSPESKGSKEGDGSFGSFWFLRGGWKEDSAAYTTAQEDYINKAQAFEDRMVEIFGAGSQRRIELKEKEFTAIAGFNKLHEASEDARKNVVSKAYGAMEDQMKNLVETGRFSARAFAEAVARQVKMELVGLSARAAVWALFETAMGLKDLATPGMQAFAALHFRSAGQFAGVSGAALLGAAAVQGAFFGGRVEKGGAAGSNGVSPAMVSGAPMPMSLTSASEPVQVRHITVQIYNPLSDENWQKIAEENIIPAINNAAARNIALTVKSA